MLIYSNTVDVFSPVTAGKIHKEEQSTGQDHAPSPVHVAILYLDKVTALVFFSLSIIF